MDSGKDYRVEDRNLAPYQGDKWAATNRTWLYEFGQPIPANS
jgi:hypothetical protein